MIAGLASRVFPPSKFEKRHHLQQELLDFEKHYRNPENHRKQIEKIPVFVKAVRILYGRDVGVESNKKESANSTQSACGNKKRKPNEKEVIVIDD